MIDLDAEYLAFKPRCPGCRQPMDYATSASHCDPCGRLREFNEDDTRIVREVGKRVRLRESQMTSSQIERKRAVRRAYESRRRA